ncbi:MAG: sugar ABC transporter substrate-binding protein [Ilumatobacteraceae bacterium]
MQHASGRFRWGTAIVVTAALALAACGGDDDDDTADTAAATTAAPATTGGADTTAAPTETTAAPGGAQIDPEARADAIELSEDELSAISNVSSGELVGIVAATMATDYHKTLNESIKARAEELGFTAEIFDSKEDPSQQLQGIEGFISKDAAAIIVTGLGGEAIGPIAQEAIDKGIFVVQVAGRDLSEVGAVTLSVEEEDIAVAEGTMAGEYAAATFGDEQLNMIITDYPEIESLVARADMIEEAFLAAYPNATFLPRILGGTAENGVTSMETALQAHDDIDGVLGINDAGNLGAYQALDTAGKTADDVFIFGIDCEPQAKEYIDAGDTMYKGCVDTNPAGTGVLAVDAFAKYVAGGTVPGILEVPVISYTGS